MLLKLARQISGAYLSDLDLDPTQELVKVAKDNNLNAREIERVANRANRQIIVGLQKMAVQGDHDPHFKFPTIKTASIIEGLEKTGSRARPKLPDLPKPDITKVFNNEKRASVHYELDDFMASGEEPPNEEVAFTIKMVKEAEAKQAKQLVMRSQLELDQLYRDFEKMASHELLSGTPAQVLRQLPVPDLVKIAENNVQYWGGMINEEDAEFEINSDHPLCKTAEKISEVRQRLEEEERSYYEKASWSGQ